MRRRLAFLLAGALAIAACGGGAAPTPSASPSKSPAPSQVITQSPAPSEAASPVPEVSAAPSTPAGTRTYKVKAGDQMIPIAKKFGVTLAALQAANPKVNPNKMQIGTILIIPSK